jgi:hypothetical protein
MTEGDGELAAFATLHKRGERGPERGRSGRPLLRLARRMRHDQLLSGDPVVVICR